LKERLKAEGDPVEIADFLKLIKGTGNATFYGCHYAASTFEIAADDLIEVADGIVDPGWFQAEKAAKADHCQYFSSVTLRRRDLGRARPPAAGRTRA
jgi:hypothetical protein